MSTKFFNSNIAAIVPDKKPAKTVARNGVCQKNLKKRLPNQNHK